MTERHFALLGTSWAKVEADDRVWPIPDGSIRWIGWPVEEFGGVSIPGPPGSTELDRRIDAGRAHVCVTLDDEGDAIDRATAVADAVAGMVASPQSAFPVETSVVPITDVDVARGTVDIDAIADTYFGGDEYAAEALRSGTHKPGALPAVLDRLDVVLTDGDGDVTGLLPAFVFWRLAVDEYALAPHEMRDALTGVAGNMATRIDQARAEQSLHNAFKAFEALIGGWPPKDATRFARRLADLGLDPGAPIGPSSTAQQPLIEHLTRLRDVRSNQAAHAGMTHVRDRSISWQTLIEAHWTVWHCIYERVEHLHRGRP